jgi:hypothetical protein
VVEQGSTALRSKHRWVQSRSGTVRAVFWVYHTGPQDVITSMVTLVNLGQYGVFDVAKSHQSNVGAVFELTKTRVRQCHSLLPCPDLSMKTSSIKTKVHTAVRPPNPLFQVTHPPSAENSPPKSPCPPTQAPSAQTAHSPTQTSPSSNRSHSTHAHFHR